jgi:protocatechuate 3,4-dioxygenase beta subunit
VNRDDTGRLWAAPLLVAIVLAVGGRAPAGTADPPAPGRMTIAGRVLDPAGKPVPGAAVMVLVRSRLADRPTFTSAIRPTSAYDRRCDGSGGFRVELPRTSSARHDALVVTARAPSFGMGWAELDPDAEAPAADVALRPEQVVRGRLFDVQGRPAREVVVKVDTVYPPGRFAVIEALRHPDADRHLGLDRPAWPGPAISDDDGRFTLRGLGRDLRYYLIVDDPRFATETILIQVGAGADPVPPGFASPNITVEAGPDPKPIAIALKPAEIVTGRVTYADTGRPVPHALVATSPISAYEADGDGRFRVPASPAASRANRIGIRAQAPEGAPYLVVGQPHEWPKGAVEQSVDVALPRGQVVRGRITEEGSGRPVAGAVVRAVPDRPPNAAALGETSAQGTFAVTGPDGTYRVATRPGPGGVVVQAPDDYVLREFGGDGGAFSARPGHDRLYAHAYRAVDVKPGMPDLVVDLALRRGATVRGRVVGPDGRPVRSAAIYSLATLWVSPIGGWRDWNLISNRGHADVHDGRFALHGLDPEGELPAYFIEPESKLGATVRFSGRSAASGPPTVRLEPCGSARCRLVDPESKPLGRYPATGLLLLVATPGPTHRRNPAKADPLFADELAVNRLDMVNYRRDARSDAEGRATFPMLIPGASYRVVDRTPVIGGGDPAVRKEFTVKPGEAVELGDILIARPRRGE